MPDAKPNAKAAVAVGKKVPDFTLAATDGDADGEFRLSRRLGAPMVLYFYPRDNTPGCTKESIDFGGAYAKFKRAGVQVFGVSRDKLSSHHRFKGKYRFPFELLADPEERVCNMFGVMKGKTMFGKKVRGIQRSTFVLDKNGVLVKEWRKVSVPGHVDEVLAFVKTPG